LAEGLSK